MQHYHYMLASHTTYRQIRALTKIVALSLHMKLLNFTRLHSTVASTTYFLTNITKSAKQLGIPACTVAKLYLALEDVKFAAGDYYLCAPPELIQTATHSLNTGLQQSQALSTNSLGNPLSFPSMPSGTSIPPHAPAPQSLPLQTISPFELGPITTTPYLL